MRPYDVSVFRNYSCAPVSPDNTFQDLPLFGETADNTERYT
jgi:hypothetical protein